MERWRVLSDPIGPLAPHAEGTRISPRADDGRAQKTRPTASSPVLDRSPKQRQLSHLSVPASSTGVSRFVCASAPISSGVLAAHSWALPRFGRNSPYLKSHINRLVFAICRGTSNIAIHVFSFTSGAHPDNRQLKCQTARTRLVFAKAQCFDMGGFALKNQATQKAMDRYK